MSKTGALSCVQQGVAIPWPIPWPWLGRGDVHAWQPPFMYLIRQWPTESRRALWCCSPHIHLPHTFNLYADRMFGTIQQFQKLTAGEQSWGEVGGGVDSGRIVGSGVFITVKSSVKDEVCRHSTCFPFCAHAECARVLSLHSE